MLADSLGFCTWVLPIESGAYEDPTESEGELITRLFTAVTGVTAGWDDMLSFADRVLALQRLVDWKHAHASRETDLEAMSKHLFCEPLEDSPLPGLTLDRGRLVEELQRLYLLRGWDPASGLPTETTLRELDMGDILALI
jgi:aldehyde:ferredoxin oxidoreductase